MELREVFLSACGVSMNRKFYEINYQKKVKRHIPSTTGAFVYGLVDNGKIVYVGCTWNLRSRLGGHGKKTFDRVIFIEFYKRQLALACERKAIQAIIPELNKKCLEIVFQTRKWEKDSEEKRRQGYVMVWKKCYSGSIGSWIHEETGLPYHEHKKLQSSPTELKEILKEEIQRV